MRDSSSIAQHSSQVPHIGTNKEATKKRIAITKWVTYVVGNVPGYFFLPFAPFGGGE